MTCRKLDLLRALTGEEREVLTQISRSASEPASNVARTKALLAVADGKNYTEAAHTAGGRAGDAVAQLVARFNREGLAAIAPRHGGGAQPLYGSAARERILREARRKPDREPDGTATWSLTTLQRALRRADDGLPHVSTYTIFKVLHEAGFSWQPSQTWCETGQVKRKRKVEVVAVTDPDADPKKSCTAPHETAERCSTRCRAGVPDG
jgi:transposase